MGHDFVFILSLFLILFLVGKCVWFSKFMLLLDVGIVQGFGKVRKQRDGKLLGKGSSKSLNLTSLQNEVRVGVLRASGYSGSDVSYMAQSF